MRKGEIVIIPPRIVAVDLYGESKIHFCRRVQTGTVRYGIVRKSIEFVVWSCTADELLRHRLWPCIPHHHLPRCLPSRLFNHLSTHVVSAGPRSPRIHRAHPERNSCSWEMLDPHPELLRYWSLRICRCREDGLQRRVVSHDRHLVPAEIQAVINAVEDRQ